MKDVIWEPTPQILAHANVARLMRRHGIADYRELIRRSTEDTSWFWQTALADLGIVWDRPYDQIQDSSRGLAWTRWFLGGRLNIATNVLRHRGAAPALIWEGDDGTTRTWSRDELRAEVG